MVSVSREYLIREYLEKDRSMSDIADELGISRGALWNRLKKQGLIGTNKKKHIVRAINDSIIDDNNSDIAYLAGLVACDGFMCRGNMIEITLSGEPGKQILHDIAKRLEYKHNIREVHNHGGFSSKPYYELVITSKNLKEYLENRYNIRGKKSDNLERFPINLINYPEHVQSAYILGIFDGDSSIDTSRGRFQICMGNESFLTMILNFLNQKFSAEIKMNYRTDREVRYPYIVIPRELSARIARWMYSSSSPCIAYKKDKVKKSFNI